MAGFRRWALLIGGAMVGNVGCDSARQEIPGVDGPTEGCAISPGYTLCDDGGCVRLADDPFNCGSCGRICADNQSCQGGDCRVGAPGEGAPESFLTPNTAAGAGGMARAGNGGADAGAAADGGNGGATDAGGADAGGTSPGGAGSGVGGAPGSGGSPASVSDGIACFLYLEAQCDRLAECKNRSFSDRCLGNGVLCPSLVIRAGSTRTNQGLLSCAEEWRTFDCDLVVRNALPDCATPGTIPAGEVCTASIECQSQECGVIDEALVCLAAAESGGACDEATACPRGEQCVDALCEQNPLPGLDDDEPVLQGIGADCLNLQNCEVGLYCAYREESPGLGECDVAPGDGEPCAGQQANGTGTPSPSTCNDDSYCGMDEICHTQPGIDEPCGEARYNGLLHCAPGGYCDRDTSTCLPWPELGEACEGAEIAQPRTGIPQTPHCDPSQGALCSCPEGVGEGCGTEQLLCLRERHPGDACDPLVDLCYYGSFCVDGLCDYPEPE